MQFKLKLSITLINNTCSNKKLTGDHQNTTLYNNGFNQLIEPLFFTKVCFDGYQFVFCLYLQHNGMHKDKKTLNLALLALMLIQ
jgi:hypothetical protein